MTETDRKSPASSMPRSIAIVGPGRVGRLLIALATAAGVAVTLLVGRRPGRVQLAGPEDARDVVAIGTLRQDVRALERLARTDLIFMAVPDREIEAAGEALFKALDGAASDGGPVVAHVSGALPVDTLVARVPRPASNALPRRIGGWHPLTAVVDPLAAAERFAGTHVAISGDADVLDKLRAFTHAVGGKPLRLRKEARARGLYHAAAVMQSNYLVTLRDAAERLLTAAIDPADAASGRAALDQLARATLANLANTSPSDVLTGPIVRGDSLTVATHLAAIASAGRGGGGGDLLATYRALAQATVRLAVRGQRLNADLAAQILRTLSVHSTQEQDPHAASDP